MEIESLFPLTTSYLGPRASIAMRAKTVEGFVEAVCAAHAKGDIPCRAARDLVQYEALRLDVPAQRTPVDKLPAEGEPCIIAPHARVLVFGAGLPAMLEALRAGMPATPRPSRGWIVLTPGEESLLWREEGWFLESFREPTRPKDVIEDDEDRALFARCWSAGILSRAAASRA